MAAVNASPGWVYILTNPSMPGLVKVGLTTRTPTARAAELAGHTGVPTPFVIAWCRAVSDCASVEAAVHRMLDDRRVSGKREFFRCDVLTARQVIEAAAAPKLGRRFRPERRATGQTRRRRRRRGNLEALWLSSSLAGLLLVLFLFKPSLPAWLPAPVAQGFATVERMGE